SGGRSRRSRGGESGEGHPGLSGAFVEEGDVGRGAGSDRRLLQGALRRGGPEIAVSRRVAERKPQRVADRARGVCSSPEAGRGLGEAYRRTTAVLNPPRSAAARSENPPAAMPRGFPKARAAATSGTPICQSRKTTGWSHRTGISWGLTTGPI